jgi:hypothetical protein
LPRKLDVAFTSRINQGFGIKRPSPRSDDVPEKFWDSYIEDAQLNCFLVASLQAALLFGLCPTAGAALAFEHADRLPGLGVHHLADDDWLTAAFTCSLFPQLGA